MGLDMYAWAVPSDTVVDELHFATNDDSQQEELFYWRKHHDLHGWMEQLYKAKGGSKEFNCQQVRLSEEDLRQLEFDVKKNLLPATTGFFFGNNPPDPESIENDLNFISKAREAIAEGKAVYYDSWW